MRANVYSTLEAIKRVRELVEGNSQQQPNATYVFNTKTVH